MDSQKHHYTKEQVQILLDWFKDCEYETILGWGRIPNKYRFMLGGVTEEDVKNENCEADYLWATEDMWTIRLKSGLLPKIKSGSASRTHNPFDTIANTSKRGTSGRKIPMAVYYAPKRKNTNTDLDDDYHPYMMNHKDAYFKLVSEKQTADAGEEMFYLDYCVDLHRIKAECICKALGISNSQNKRQISPNTQQKRPAEDIIEKLSIPGIFSLTVFIGYKCRYPGKTISVLYAFNKIKNCNVILVFARRKNIAESWERNTQYFEKVIYITLKDFLNLTYIDPLKKYVVTCTVQSMEDHDKTEDEEKENEKLKQYFNDFLCKIKNKKFWVVLDEAHQGGTAESTVEILKKFTVHSQCQVRLDVSGTGQKLFRRNEYNLEYHYDIIDEEKDRSHYLQKLNLSYDNSILPYLPLNNQEWIDKITALDFKNDPDSRVILSPKKCTMVMDHMQLTLDEKELKRHWSNAGIPPMSHLLSEGEYGIRFTNSVNNMVDWVVGEGQYKSVFSQLYDKGFIRENNRSYFSNWGFMFFVKEIKHGEILQLSLKRYSYIDVIFICGEYKSQEEINREVRWSILMNRLPIIISCGSHGEGSDLNLIISTFHFDNGTSGEAKTQRGQRGATSYMDKVRPNDNVVFKSVHYDVYFDMAQAMKVCTPEITKRNKQSNERIERTIEEYRNANPTYSIGLEVKEIDSFEYQEAVREQMKLDKIKKQIINLEFDRSKLISLNENFWSGVNKAMLKGIDTSILLGKKEKKAKGDKLSPKQNNLTDKKGTNDQDKLKNFDKFLNNLIEALDGFVTLPFFTLNDITTLDEIFENVPDDSFYNNLGVIKNVYKELIKMDIINEESINYFLSTRIKLI